MAAHLVLGGGTDQRTATDLRAFLPRDSLGVLEQDPQVGLRRRRHPLLELAPGHAELLAHLDKLVAFPHLYRLEVAAERHYRRRIDESNDYAAGIRVAVIEQLQM